MPNQLMRQAFWLLQQAQEAFAVFGGLDIEEVAGGDALAVDRQGQHPGDVLVPPRRMISAAEAKSFRS